MKKEELKMGNKGKNEKKECGIRKEREEEKKEEWRNRS